MNTRSLNARRELEPALRTHGLPALASLAAALLLPAAAANAQVVLSRPTFSPGGGVVTNGTLRAVVTIGQPLAGRHEVTGQRALENGFWTRGVAVQTAGAPPLRVSRAGNSLILAWAAAPAGFRLQVAEHLGPTASWQFVPDPATLSGGDSTVTLPVTPALRFYRLLRPPSLP